LIRTVQVQAPSKEHPFGWCNCVLVRDGDHVSKVGLAGQLSFSTTVGFLLTVNRTPCCTGPLSISGVLLQKTSASPNPSCLCSMVLSAPEGEQRYHDVCG
jgi:hypothetical protein